MQTIPVQKVRTLFSALTLSLSVLFILAGPLNMIAQSKTVHRPPIIVKKPSTDGLVYGKYTCTASKYRNGSYEFIPRGSFTISQNGQYSYYGFEKPSSGTFLIDDKRNLLFKGGYLDGGKAEKIDRLIDSSSYSRQTPIAAGLPRW